MDGQIHFTTLDATTDEIGAKLVEHVRGFDELNLQPPLT